jgi:hypothetical protein
LRQDAAEKYLKRLIQSLNMQYASPEKKKRDSDNRELDSKPKVIKLLSNLENEEITKQA